MSGPRFPAGGKVLRKLMQFNRYPETESRRLMKALCVPSQARPWQQDWTRITIWVVVVIILAVAAFAGWTLADVVAVITATAAAAAATGDRGTAT